MSRPPCTTAEGTPKFAYRSRSSAERAARRTRHDYADKALRAYHCPSCGRWHVGHDTAAEDVAP